MNSSIAQAVTLAIAFLGAALGILNAWRAWSLDRLRARVIPTYSIDAAGRPYISIEVVNLSNFAVTITSVGFTVLGSKTHIQLLAPLFIGANNLPVRLESRTSFTALAAFSAFENGQMAMINRAYAKTACGNQIEGDSRALRQIVDAAFAAQK